MGAARRAGGVMPAAARPAASWHGHLQLHYRRAGDRTIAHDRHQGPLRVLQRLYPEGPAICHHVLVHPPGGIVGGDRLAIDAELDPGTHALITTPGATRFYRSSGAAAAQHAVLRLAAGSRLEWLPLETIAYRGCIAENRVRFELAGGAEMIGWDLLALGLPAAGEAFDSGSFTQQLELPGHWLERGRIDAADKRLLDSPVGLAGQRVIATAWFAAGTPLSAVRREALLEAAREASAAMPSDLRCGATSPHASVVVLRVLAARVEPAMALLAQVRAAWRLAAWALPSRPPRIWKT
jgi:urease accessory protein